LYLVLVYSYPPGPPPSNTAIVKCLDMCHPKRKPISREFEVKYSDRVQVGIIEVVSKLFGYAPGKLL
jgi:hypothetical protein